MRLASIDSASGEKLWARMDEDPSADAVRRYPAPKWCGYAMYNYKRAQSAPTVCGDAVVVGTQSGEIVAFSRVTGEQLWRKNVDWPANGPTVAVNNSVFFGTYGQVVALECKSGDLGAALLVEGGMQALLLYGGGIYGQAAMCDVFAAKPEQWPKVTWRFRRCFGSCNNEDYECFSQGGGVLWKAPSDTRAGNKHDGIRLDDPGIRYVHFPEPPPYDGMAPGKMVRNPLLSWKDRWIAVEAQGIVVYEDYAIELDTGE
jgi:outer membrane protein assembly factor BamB